MRRHVLMVGLCLAAGAGCGVIWHVTHARAAAAPSAEVAPIPVVAERVQISDMPMVLTGIGSVVAYNAVDIHAQVTGVINKIGFTEGQTVHPGNLIAQLDPRPAQAALQQAQASLARDSANLIAAQANLRRYVPLLKEGFATQQQVADQTATVEELQASIASDKATVFSAATQLSYTRITSPISGVTGIKRVDIGNLVQPSSTTPIVTITQIQPISVTFTLPQADLSEVQEAMTKGPLPVTAYGQDDHTKLDQGTLLMVNNTVNQSSGTIQLKATFPNAKRNLWPGQFVNVQLVLRYRANAVSVPLTALQQGQNGSLVYLLRQNGTVEQRAVDIAETLDGKAVVRKGLKSGDVVVVAGQYRLTDGVKVQQVPQSDPSVQNSTEASAGMLG